MLCSSSGDEIVKKSRTFSVEIHVKKRRMPLINSETKINLLLTGVAQLGERHPTKSRVAGQGTCRRQLIDVFSLPSPFLK